MEKSLFKITQMDCPSEENLIRIKLDGVKEVKYLDFNIPERELLVFHSGQFQEIEALLQDLNLGCQHISTEVSSQTNFEEDKTQRQLLWTVLSINLAFFVIEMTAGVVSKSMGLVADSLDMLADASVYGISLLAVGQSVVKKKRVAKLAGYFQLLLALLGFLEVLRRFFFSDTLPEFETMISVSILALMANGFCLYLLQKSKSKTEAHMQASMIFTSNDVIINLGVISAGVLVLWLDSSLPDLIIGILVFALVIKGAFRILKLANS